MIQNKADTRPKPKLIDTRQGRDRNMTEDKDKGQGGAKAKTIDTLRHRDARQDEG
jgi:hypothetical protein